MKRIQSCRPDARAPGLTGAAGSACGFTLVEVLLAAAILGLGVTVLLTAASRCLAVVKKSANYQTARWTMQRAELEHPFIIPEDKQDWDPTEMDVDGESYPDGMTYSRKVTPRDEKVEDGLYEVKSRVQWSSRGTESAEEIVRYVFVRNNAKDLQK